LCLVMKVEAGLDATLLRESVEALADDMGLLLVDLGWFQSGRRGTLRVLVDRPGRVTIGECEKLSRAIEDMMDRDMLEPGSFVLEVGSPGVGRRLESENDWKRCVGRTVRVETEGDSFEDEIISYEGGCLVFAGCRIVPSFLVTRAVEVLETGGNRGRKA